MEETFAELVARTNTKEEIEKFYNMPIIFMSPDIANTGYFTAGPVCEHKTLLIMDFDEEDETIYFEGEMIFGEKKVLVYDSKEGRKVFEF